MSLLDQATVRWVRWIGGTLGLLVTGAIVTGAVRWAGYISSRVEESATTKQVQDLAREQMGKVENLAAIHGNRLTALETAAAQAFGERLRLVASYDEFRKITHDALTAAQEERKALMRQGTVNETKLETVIRQLATLDAKIEQFRR